MQGKEAFYYIYSQTKHINDINSFPVMPLFFDGLCFEYDENQ